MIDQNKDQQPSVSRTVARIVQFIKEAFFDLDNDLVRHEISETLIAMLENCFVDKRYGQ